MAYILYSNIGFCNCSHTVTLYSAPWVGSSPDFLSIDFNQRVTAYNSKWHAGLHQCCCISIFFGRNETANYLIISAPSTATYPELFGLFNIVFILITFTFWQFIDLDTLLIYFIQNLSEGTYRYHHPCDMGSTPEKSKMPWHDPSTKQNRLLLNLP